MIFYFLSCLANVLCQILSFNGEIKNSTFISTRIFAGIEGQAKGVGEQGQAATTACWQRLDKGAIQFRQATALDDERRSSTEEVHCSQT